MRATASIEQIKKLSLKKGDVIITKDSETADDIAVPALIDEDIDNLVCGYHLALLRPNNCDIDGRFLLRILQSTKINDQFAVSANGVTRFGISTYPIKNSYLIIPPIEEQKQISSYIGKETSQINVTIEKYEKLIELLKEKRIAIISHAVTKGLNPGVKMKNSGVEWIGEIPENWDIVSLRWHISIKSGDSISNEQFELEISDEYQIPVIGGNGIMGYTNKLNVAVNTIVIGRVGALCGNIHFINEEAWITDNALMITKIGNFSFQYLAHSLQSMNINSLASKNAQPLITGGLIKSQKMPNPPIHEQKQIEIFIDQETSKIDQLIEKINKQIELLNEYKTSLISHAVTGKIDVRQLI